MAAVNLEPRFGLRSSRQALLVIHGIGEQNPYETLDSFARGVFTYLAHAKGLNAKLCPIQIAHEDWTQVGIRIGLFVPGRVLPLCPVDGEPVPPGDEPDAYVDIFEYYWAPDTEDKLSVSDTLKWVLKTDFTPLRYFADNLQEMMGARGMKLHSALWSAATIYFRELLRIFFLYPLLGLGAGLLLWWLYKGHNWGTALNTLGTALLPYLGWKPSVVLFSYAVFLLMAYFGLQSLIEFHLQPGKSIQKQAETIWLVFDILLAAISLGLGLFLDFRSRSSVLSEVWKIIARNENWQPLAGAAIAALVSYVLTAYVADVAVYVNTDPKSKNYATHNAILDGSTTALKLLLRCGRYDRVTLAGHSLGSAIAYDTINELLDECNASPGPAGDRPDPPLSLAQLRTLKGMVTFGSPLDKIYYFFRTEVKRDQAIRAQILAMLHSFRTSHSGRDYGEFAFNYKFGQLDGVEPLVWVNAWARMDPVSADLKFYHPDDQREFHYLVPVLAHLSYWSDPNFYEYFATWLL
jgi:hypothetical protein